MLILASLLALPSVARADLPASPSALCRSAIIAAERSTGVPDRLMQSIGAVESGRRNADGTVSAWPWTINAEGVGSYFATKGEAMAAVTALRARGVRSVDVGCMQVNLMYHAEAFSSLEEAFDPGANARYAGQFLQTLLAKTGSWPGATAGYHSLTPEIGADYARKVLAIWARPASRPGADGAIRQAELQPGAPPASTGYHHAVGRQCRADHPVAGLHRRRTRPEQRPWAGRLPGRTDQACVTHDAGPPQPELMTVTKPMSQTLAGN